MPLMLCKSNSCFIDSCHIALIYAVSETGITTFVFLHLYHYICITTFVIPVYETAKTFFHIMQMCSQMYVLEHSLLLIIISPFLYIKK